MSKPVRWRLWLTSGAATLALLGVGSAAAGSDVVDQQPELSPADASETEILQRQKARAEASDDVPQGPTSGAFASCGSGLACMWARVGYDGERRTVDGSLGGLGWLDYDDGYSWRSSMNSFGNRRFQVRLFAGDPEQRCMDPGENRPNMPLMVELRVGVNGSRCE